MPVAKGMWEGLMDFSFRTWATPRMLKFLYALHLLVGLIAGVAWVVIAFQQAPVQGLLALLACVGIGYAYRIQVEEAALIAALGEPYKDYMRRTQRLVPFVL